MWKTFHGLIGTMKIKCPGASEIHSTPLPLSVMEPQQPSKKQKRKQRKMTQKKKALPITTQQKNTQSKSMKQKSTQQKSKQQTTQQKHQAQRSKDHQLFYDNPIKTLKNLRPGAVYECVAQPYDSGMPHFVMTVSVDGQVYGGAGCKKLLAQTRAAQTALGKIHNLKSATKQGMLAFTMFNHLQL